MLTCSDLYHLIPLPSELVKVGPLTNPTNQEMVGKIVEPSDHRQIPISSGPSILTNHPGLDRIQRPG
ncbi:hypothetical protein ACOSQ2_030030 [Xanthoceras sorbifolium]